MVRRAPEEVNRNLYRFFWAFLRGAQGGLLKALIARLESLLSS
jgi:hypothetical protein